MSLTTKRKLLAASPFIFLLLLIAVYSFFRTSDLVRGPEIVISSPSEGEVASDALIEIEGVAKRISSLSLNGRPIFTDQAGVFVEPLLLTQGYNILEIKAKDRFGREVIKTLTVVL